MMLGQELITRSSTAAFFSPEAKSFTLIKLTSAIGQREDGG